MDWYSAIDQVKDLVVVDVSEVSRIQEEVQRKTEGASDVSMEDLEALTKLKAIAEEIGKKSSNSMSDTTERGNVEQTQGKNAAHPDQEESAKPGEESSGSQETEDAKNLPQPDFSEGLMIGTEKALKREEGK